MKKLRTKLFLYQATVSEVRGSAGDVVNMDSTPQNKKVSNDTSTPLAEGETAAAYRPLQE